MAKTKVDDINRNIYDIKNKEKDSKISEKVCILITI